MTEEASRAKRHPFAIWSLPGSSNWSGIRQYNDEVINEFTLDAEGFLVAPFQKQAAIKFIRNDIKIQSLEELDMLASFPNRSDDSLNDEPIQISHEDYIKNCQLLIDSLNRKEAAKVVLSRIKSVPFNIKPKQFFIKLMEAYPNAMVFMYSFGKELWIGASPEILFEGDSSSFKTMALAGSMPANKEEIKWSSKEIEEHAYVEKYIEAILNEKELSYMKRGPETVQAGPVLHIKSQYEGKIDSAKIESFIKAMHPTPAVCGIPLLSALKLIAQFEKHDRLDYSGYIGPVANNKLDLFVNLRSAMILGHKMHLFLGGGITRDSDAETEWKETEWKAETLLSIL